MFYKLFLSATLALSLVAPVLAQNPKMTGEIDVIKAGLKENPKLFFKGIENAAPELQQKMMRTLQNCGWFDVVNGNQVNYIVAARKTGENSLELRLMNSAGSPMFTKNITADNPDDLVYESVDAILAQLFNVPGLCRSKIVFAIESGKQNKEIYLCNFDGSGLKQITDNQTLSIEPKWTPDGRYIVYSYFGTSFAHLVQYDLKNGKSRKVSRYPGLNAGGTMSPGGNDFIALILAKDNQRVDLYIRETEGNSAPVRMTNDAAVEASPVWSPDGKTLCYVSDASGRPRLYTIGKNAARQGKRIDGLSGSEQASPSWSSDGKIAYTAKSGGTYVVAVKDMKSGKNMIVGRNNQEIPGEGPSWAPDNRHLVVAYRGNLYVVDTFLGKSRPLFKTAQLKLSQPNWSPIIK